MTSATVALRPNALSLNRIGDFQTNSVRLPLNVGYAFPLAESAGSNEKEISEIAVIASGSGETVDISSEAPSNGVSFRSRSRSGEEVLNSAKERAESLRIPLARGASGRGEDPAALSLTLYSR